MPYKVNRVSAVLARKAHCLSLSLSASLLLSFLMCDRSIIFAPLTEGVLSFPSLHVVVHVTSRVRKGKTGRSITSREPGDKRMGCTTTKTKEGVLTLSFSLLSFSFVGMFTCTWMSMPAQEERRTRVEI